jgi:hypothetical protein
MVPTVETLLDTVLAGVVVLPPVGHCCTPVLLAVEPPVLLVGVVEPPDALLLGLVDPPEAPEAVMPPAPVVAEEEQPTSSPSLSPGVPAPGLQPELAEVPVLVPLLGLVDPPEVAVLPVAVVEPPEAPEAVVPPAPVVAEEEQPTSSPSLSPGVPAPGLQPELPAVDALAVLLVGEVAPPDALLAPELPAGCVVLPADVLGMVKTCAICVWAASLSSDEEDGDAGGLVTGFVFDAADGVAVALEAPADAVSVAAPLVAVEPAVVVAGVVSDAAVAVLEC